MLAVTAYGPNQFTVAEVDEQFAKTPNLGFHKKHPTGAPMVEFAIRAGLLVTPGIYRFEWIGNIPAGFNRKD